MLGSGKVCQVLTKTRPGFAASLVAACGLSPLHACAKSARVPFRLRLVHSKGRGPCFCSAPAMPFLSPAPPFLTPGALWPLWPCFLCLLAIALNQKKQSQSVRAPPFFLSGQLPGRARLAVLGREVLPLTLPGGAALRPPRPPFGRP